MGITDINVYSSGVDDVVLTAYTGDLDNHENTIITIPGGANAQLQNGGPNATNGPFIVRYTMNGYILNNQFNNYNLVGGAHQFS